MPLSRPTAGQNAFTLALGFICCVCVPLFVSAIAPISVVRLQRQDGRVTAEVTTRTFYVIPYRRVVVENVREVDDRYRAGTTYREQRSSRKEHQSESESFLVLQGSNQVVEVPVSPVNSHTVKEQAQAFVAASLKTDTTPQEPSVERSKESTASEERRLTMVANWKFGVIVPLVLSPLLLLYVVGSILAICRWFWRLAVRKPAQTA